MIDNMDDFRALEPFFRTIEQGLAAYVDGEHFFDMLAEDVVFDFIITVPNYPRHVVGRDNLIELYRGYGSVFFLAAATTCGPTTHRQRLRSCSNTPPRARSSPPATRTATDTFPWSSSRTAKSPNGAITWIHCESSPPSKADPSSPTGTQRPLREMTAG